MHHKLSTFFINFVAVTSTLVYSAVWNQSSAVWSCMNHLHILGSKTFFTYFMVDFQNDPLLLEINTGAVLLIFLSNFGSPTLQLWVDS